MLEGRLQDDHFKLQVSYTVFYLGGYIPLKGDITSETLPVWELKNRQTDMHAHTRCMLIFPRINFEVYLCELFAK